MDYKCNINNRATTGQERLITLQQRNIAQIQERSREIAFRAIDGNGTESEGSYRLVGWNIYGYINVGYIGIRRLPARLVFLIILVL
jgi:hypothetical protein